MRRHKINSLRRFERLEDRRMMAADIDLDNGILSIEGTGNDDMIVIESNPNDADEVLVRIENALTGQVLEDADYDLDDIELIHVDALGGHDQVINYLNIRAEIYGRGGNDHLVGGNAGDLLDGGADHDSLIGNGGDDELKGGSGDDRYGFYYPQQGSDIISEDANVNTDEIWIMGGFPVGFNLDLAVTTTQVVAPGHLSLRLTSATGIENVYGSRHDDTIRGNSRDNLIYGTDGNDTLYGRDGADTLVGGDDNDELYGGGGVDRLRGEAGDDYLYGEAGDDDLFGGDNNDVMYGGAGNDDMFGDAGDDHLYGESGIDNLNGGDDNDFLAGGGGGSGAPGSRDQLTGGGGSDLFVRHRSLRSRYTIFDDLLDYASAVDEVMTLWY